MIICQAGLSPIWKNPNTSARVYLKNFSFQPHSEVFPKRAQKSIDEQHKNSSKPAFPHKTARDAGDNRPSTNHTIGNPHIAEQPILNFR